MADISVYTIRELGQASFCQAWIGILAAGQFGLSGHPKFGPGPVVPDKMHVMQAKFRTRPRFPDPALNRIP